MEEIQNHTHSKLRKKDKDMDNVKKVFSQRFCSLFKEQNYKSISAFLREYKERYPYESFTRKVFLQYRNAEATPSIDRLHNLCNMWNVSSDYLLGLSEKKECKDIQYISKTTGLSEETIKSLRYIYEEAAFQETLSKMLNVRYRLFRNMLEKIVVSNTSTPSRINRIEEKTK